MLLTLKNGRGKTETRIVEFTSRGLYAAEDKTILTLEIHKNRTEMHQSSFYYSGLSKDGDSVYFTGREVRLRSSPD